MVTLGSGSTLRYPRSFNGNTREIQLTGEAFFNVTKNPNKPFIVHTRSLQTRVLGTSFKIDAFNGQPVVVAVATGKVQVDRNDSGSNQLPPLAVLLPGNEVTWSPESGKAILSHVVIEDIAGWEKGQLAFTGTPLREVANRLERWYNVKIAISNKRKAAYRMNCILDGTQPLKKSLEVLKATIQSNYTIKDSVVIIQ